MQVGQFHTPSLRGIGRTGPWGHGGSFATLNEVVLHYAAGLTLEPVAGAVLGKIVVLVLLILFIQRRPRGMFPLKGRAVEA